MNRKINGEEFAYDKTWSQIETLLKKVETRMNDIKIEILKKNTRMSMRDQLLRDYKGLEGVSNALRWTLGDVSMPVEEVLGLRR